MTTSTAPLSGLSSASTSAFAAITSGASSSVPHAPAALVLMDFGAGRALVEVSRDPGQPAQETPDQTAPAQGPPTPGIDGPATPGVDGESGKGPAPGGGFGSIWPLLLIGAIIWFLIFAPERKARKQRDQMIASLKKNDRVVTTGGLHAVVVEVRENDVVLKAGDTRLTFSRSAVHQILDAGADAEKA